MLNNLNILVTGASGFLGQYVVNQALKKGHNVKAISRLGNSALWESSEKLEVVSADLLTQESISKNLQGIDVVIHLAISKTGNSQLTETVQMTKNLLEAMHLNGIKRLIAVSSFSVFDYFNIPVGSTIDENSPIESNPEKRDSYAQMKLKQEELYREFQENQQGQVTILRPGMIYGKDNLWSSRLGVKKGDKTWILIDSSAQLPLIYVENCAAAIILATESDASINQVINLVDDQLVEQSTYLRQIIPYLAIKPKLVRINWSLINIGANLVGKTNQVLFNGKKSLPGLLSPHSLQARFKPLKYTNTYAKKVLDWQPQYHLETALKRIVELSN
jgi:nucleoside-diphosphate-sugar epimerase